MPRRRNSGLQRVSRLALENLEKRQLLAADLSIDLWSEVLAGKPKAGWTSYINAPSARLLRLDEPQLTKLVSADTETGMESGRSMADDGETWKITLPTPDGGTASFQYEASAVMAPELAARFPEIRTYRGQGIDDPAATIQFDVSPNGIHAQVLSPNGAWYIDPYYHNVGDTYAIYYKRDALPRANNSFVELSEMIVPRGPKLSELEFHQDVGLQSEKGSKHQDTKLDSPVLNRSGLQLRTYRLAVSATGEYTQFHGGTVAAGLSAIVTAMTRVNGVYEQELAITMQLVANNDLLVFTNPSTDPFSNNNAGAMLTENQTAVDTRIGNANYDIGHVFSTGGGGVAFLRSVGSTTTKAGGVSGLPQPIGDPFYVDYVAHEMGHQFGGNHTFNGDSGFCAGGNRNAATAFEPGSGSTIQAYAGICGNDNLQTNSDLQFHSISFDEIVAFVDTLIPLVGTRTNTGNAIPSVDAGGDFTIPTGTPFTLTATGADANSEDVLTYSWEQRDLGPQSDINAADNGSIPLFRVFPHTTNPSRTFPRLSDLINNTTTIGERLPTVARPSMDFRVTVRDNRSGGGGVNTDDMVVTVVNTGAAFQVTEPNLASVEWPVNSSQSIRWNVAGTTGNGIDTANVDIDLSLDGGLTYPVSLLSSTPNDGEASIVVPNFQTNSARVRVKGSGNIFFDISNANFTITPELSTLDFGDAPNVYGTLLADNGPRHTVGSLFLGALVDTEVDGLPGSGADGDGIDEDGVRILDPMVAGTDVRLEVTASQAGVLDYFIDFDGQGGFANVAGEAFTANLVAGSQVLTVSIPSNASGESYMRFRLSAEGGLSPLGPAASGEVEDYRVDFLTEPPGVDFGDAPLQSLLAEDGARHQAFGPQLGATRGEATEARANPTATGDGGDDGVAFGELFLPGSSASAMVTSSGGVLDYFVDFDRNGVFGNAANEVFSMTIAPGTVAVPIAIPASVTPGPTFARFRLSSAGGLSATGLANDGEVEDYQVMVSGLVTTPVDYQSFDASTAIPPGWSVLPATGTRWNVVTTGASSAPNAMSALGVSVVSDQRLTSPPISVSVDNRVFEFANNYITENTYDGGVLEVSVNGAAFQDLLAVGGTFQSNGYNGTISNSFGSPIGNRQAWMGNSGGWLTTRFTLPESLIGESVQLRWRFATDESVAVGRWLVDSIRIVGGAEPQRDYGDAPAGFPTLVLANGASHVVDPNIRLGATVDTESNGRPTAAADGDIDDGIVLPAAGAAIGSTIDILVNASNDRSILSAWFDFNDDGDWDDAGEHAIRDVAITQANQVVPLQIPLDAQLSDGVAARFRLSRQAGLMAVGAAGDGEVEDYLLRIVAPSAEVEGVYGFSTLWSSSFIDAIDGGGMGSGNGVGLELIPGSDIIPWRGLNRLQFQFSTNVTGVSDTTIEVRNSQGPLPIVVQYDDSSFIATVEIGAAVDFSRLRISVSDAILDSQGTALDGDNDGTPGGIYSVRIDVLAADADRSGRVNGADLGAFSSAFNTQPGQAQYNPRADWNGDGRVNGADLGVFSANFNRNLDTLEEPGAPFSGSRAGRGWAGFNDFYFGKLGGEEDDERLRGRSRRR